MTDKFEIERLEGRGITAVVTDSEQIYTTYHRFAEAAGYPDSSVKTLLEGGKKARSSSKLGGKTVEVLAKGKHERGYDVLYVVQAEDGERFLFGGKGLEISEQPTLANAALTDAHDAIDELRRKAYAEGFDAGRAFEKEQKPKRFAEILAKHREKVTKETPQQIRDMAIEQAKADVKELTLDAQVNLLRPKFVINREKRTIVCLLERFDLGYIACKGIAKCAPDDCFNVHIGKAIALRRALGLDVPAEYLNAPRPETVRVGDVVSFDHPFHTYVIESGMRVVNLQDGKDYTNYANLSSARIIDDSREVSV